MDALFALGILIAGILFVLRILMGHHAFSEFVARVPLTQRKKPCGTLALARAYRAHGGEGDLLQRPAYNGISALFATGYQAD